jgi:pSer/pThr/pTyr-binding forkhead associated (FHA) protein
VPDRAALPGSRHSSSPAELVERNKAQRAGVPFLLYRDGAGTQRIFQLQQPAPSLSIGRGPANDLLIDWDENVSRVHAELASVGGEWTLTDDGLSRNGSYINGERVMSRRRLHDGDVIRVGSTALVYHDSRSGRHDSTARAGSLPITAQLSPAKRRVLIALARPFREGKGFATPASNQQIAAELYLSVDAVKTHLRGLFDLFEVAQLPQNQKRAKLVERAFASGIITARDLKAQD